MRAISLKHSAYLLLGFALGHGNWLFAENDSELPGLQPSPVISPVELTPVKPVDNAIRPPIDNNAPVAMPDFYLVDPGGVLNVTAEAGLLLNDFDPDEDDLHISSNSGPYHGTLTLPSDGSFQYVPDPDFVGTDLFVYRVSDGNGRSGQARVDLRVGTGVIPHESGVISVGDSNWKKVFLSQHYFSMIVVVTPNYGAASAPLVTRVKNRTANSFELKVDRFDGLASPTGTVDVHYFVVEEGRYNVAEHGMALESRLLPSDTTDHHLSWQGVEISLDSIFINPVVLGQVFDYKDPRPSVFWARGTDPAVAPSANALYVGRHTGEDTDTERLAESLGLIVIEAGEYVIGDERIIANITDPMVSGMQQLPAFQQPLTGLLSVNAAVLSSAGMIDVDGGWPVLSGADPLSETSVRLVIDEDQMGDAEREHAAEQVAYLVSGSVVDTTPPVISLLGDDPQSIPIAGSYVEGGATAFDNVDGDISAFIVVDSSSVDTSIEGAYTVSYDVSDAAGNAAPTVTRAVNVDDATIKVMPIGDSITEGESNHHTYRYYLSQAYPAFDMVGSRSGVLNGGSPLDSGFDQDHEGYWGWRADSVAQQVDTAADIYLPDVALVHLGTNDMIQDEAIELTIGDLEDVVQHLRDANPDVIVLLAQLIVCNYSCSERDDINNEIAALVPQLSTEQSPVILVPMDNIVSSDLWDAFHPNNNGALKMMQNWEQGLIEAGVISQPEINR